MGRSVGRPHVGLLAFARYLLGGNEARNRIAISTFHSKAHADVRLRVFDLTKKRVDPSAGGKHPGVNFPEEDAARTEELNSRAREAGLTDEENAELEAYRRSFLLRAL